jgi:hypothetical protein
MAGHKDNAFAGLQRAIDVFPALDTCAAHDLGGGHVRQVQEVDDVAAVVA